MIFDRWSIGMVSLHYSCVYSGDDSVAPVPHSIARHPPTERCQQPALANTLLL